MDIRKKKMKECVELVLFYVEEIVVYIHLQQIPICCCLPACLPVCLPACLPACHYVQLVVDVS